MSPMVSTPLTLEHALLGFLRQRPMHAYEMHQQLARAKTLGRVWHLKQSHLYALLARLENAGYIATSTEQQGSRPPRKVMSLTAEGQAAFERWLIEPVAHGRDFRIEFLAKLFFASENGAATATLLIDRQRQECDAWLADLGRQVETLAPERTYDRLVLRFRVSQIAAIRSWLDVCAETLAPAPSK
ncbi:MAG: PadR family transcriptional regulator [Chloroflexota bacterium]